MEKIKDVEEILKEKTEAYKCGDKTVEITEYNLCEQDDMIGINKHDESDAECDAELNKQPDQVEYVFLAKWCYCRKVTYYLSPVSTLKVRRTKLALGWV